MKKILLLGMLVIGMSCFGQEKQLEGTTQKEYNYASKGYADDLAMGKDIILGYKLERVLTPKQSRVTEITGNKKTESVRYTFIYKLVRIETNQVAVLILEEKRPESKFTRYYALPNSYSDNTIWSLAQDAYLKNFDVSRCENGSASFSYSWNVLRLLSEALSSN